MIRLTDGNDYEVAYEFESGRKIIVYAGLYVLVDPVENGEYELSGEPARVDELPILNQLVSTIKDTLTVIKTNE